MEKIITEEQIKAVLNIIYKLNAKVQDFDAVSKFFKELPVLPETKKKETKDK